VGDPIAFVLIATAVLVGAAIALVRLGGRDSDAALDRRSRARIRQRIGELGQATQEHDPGAKPGLSRPGPGVEPRRRLWRDTSAILVLTGSLVLIGFALWQTPPRGGVLGATSAPSEASEASLAATATAQTDDPMLPGESTTTAGSAVPPTQATPMPAVEAGPTVAPTNAPASPRRIDTADRMSVLTPCPGQPDCFLYTLDRNPQVHDPSRVHAGERITLPRPRR
jgi:hypothetical protein